MLGDMTLIVITMRFTLRTLTILTMKDLCFTMEDTPKVDFSSWKMSKFHPTLKSGNWDKTTKLGLTEYLAKVFDTSLPRRTTI